MANDLVLDALLSHIPGSRKTTSSNWISYNGPCCVHNGQSKPDTRKRSGIKYDPNGRTSVHCFNCEFNAWWAPGRMLSNRLKDYLGWLGMVREDINKLDFRTWQLKQNALLDPSYVAPEAPARLEFTTSRLPRSAMPITMWIDEGCEDENFHTALEYLIGRGEDILEATDYYWTPETTNQLNERILIPFLWEGEIVGWTARLTTGDASRRYFSEVQPHYIFNTGALKTNWEYVLVTEGPFDGLAIGGVSMLGDKVTNEQAAWLNQLGKTIIVVPDRVNGGGRLVDAAIERGWHVSFPRWDQGVKDAADAVSAYGKLYTLWSIIDAKTRNKLDINVKRQRLR